LLLPDTLAFAYKNAALVNLRYSGPSDEMMGYNVTDKTVLVTGANRGIGLALVISALEQGAAKVYAAVRQLDSAEPLVQKFGDRVVPIVIDLENHASIRQAAATATDAEVVINNAGVLTVTDPLSENAIGSLQFEINVNVIGLIHMAQAFAPVLKANGGGVFVQLNSVVSLKAFASFSTYSASKAASYSITQSLREALAAQGTQVISVHPGPIATDMATSAGLDEIAEPVSVVPDALWRAMNEGQFHVFPDSMAREIGMAYQAFSDSVIETPLGEGA